MLAFVFLEPVQDGNVGVIERSEELRFAFESRNALGIVRERFRKNFHSDTTVQTCIARGIHHAHAAGSKLSFDHVVPDCFPDHVRGILLQRKLRPPV